MSDSLPSSAEGADRPFLKLCSCPHPDQVTVGEINYILALLSRIAKRNKLAWVGETLPVALRINALGRMTGVEFKTVKIDSIKWDRLGNHIVFVGITPRGKEIPLDQLFLVTGQWLPNAVFTDLPPTVAPWVIHPEQVATFVPEGLLVAQAAGLKKRRHVIRPSEQQTSPQG